MKQVAARDVPTYFELEQSILTTGRVDKAPVLSLLRDSVKGSIDDKARLLLIVYVNCLTSHRIDYNCSHHMFSSLVRYVARMVPEKFQVKKNTRQPSIRDARLC